MITALPAITFARSPGLRIEGAVGWQWQERIAQTRSTARSAFRSPNGLPRFDLDRTLVADAREIASGVDGREREIFEAFGTNYPLAVPPALRPDTAAAEAMKTAGVRNMRILFEKLDSIQLAAAELSSA